MIPETVFKHVSLIFVNLINFSLIFHSFYKDSYIAMAIYFTANNKQIEIYCRVMITKSYKNTILLFHQRKKIIWPYFILIWICFELRAPKNLSPQHLNSGSPRVEYIVPTVVRLIYFLEGYPRPAEGKNWRLPTQLDQSSNWSPACRLVAPMKKIAGPVCYSRSLPRDVTKFQLILNLWRLVYISWCPYFRDLGTAEPIDSELPRDSRFITRHGWASNFTKRIHPAKSGQFDQLLILCRVLCKYQLLLHIPNWCGSRPHCHGDCCTRLRHADLLSTFDYLLLLLLTRILLN